MLSALAVARVRSIEGLTPPPPVGGPPTGVQRQEQKKPRSHPVLRITWFGYRVHGPLHPPPGHIVSLRPRLVHPFLRARRLGGAAGGYLRDAGLRRRRRRRRWRRGTSRRCQLTISAYRALYRLDKQVSVVFLVSAQLCGLELLTEQLPVHQSRISTARRISSVNTVHPPAPARVSATTA